MNRRTDEGSLKTRDQMMTKMYSNRAKAFLGRHRSCFDQFGHFWVYPRFTFPDGIVHTESGLGRT